MPTAELIPAEAPVVMRVIIKLAAAISLGYVWFLAPIWVNAQSNAKPPSFGVGKPVSERTMELGCWILVDQPVGRIEEGQDYWHLDVYWARADAEKPTGYEAR